MLSSVPGGTAGTQQTMAAVTADGDEGGTTGGALPSEQGSAQGATCCTSSDGH